jgi:O-antigen ligase
LHIRELLLLIAFCFFLLPFSISGNSANYAFLLLPLGALATGRIQIPPRQLVLFILIYVLIFVLAVIYQHDWINELPRRAISFALFMSAFTYMFMQVDSAMVRAFKRAVVITGVVFSLSSIGAFFALGGSELGFEAKDAVGGQRFGFIYILAFWLLCLSPAKAVRLRLLELTAAFIVLSGLFLTFSRASVVALLFSGVAYAIWSIRHEARFPLRRVFRRLAVSAFGLVAAAALLGTLFPVVLDFFEVRLFGLLIDCEPLQANLGDAETSEGTRFFIWKSILEYVAFNPLTGSGYLGVWILGLFEELSGSAHNQYFDVLFRVGVLGFVIYIFCFSGWDGSFSIKMPDYFGVSSASLSMACSTKRLRSRMGASCLRFYWD